MGHTRLNFNIARTKEVLPDPDSPTIPIVCFVFKFILIESTAFT